MSAAGTDILHVRLQHRGMSVLLEDTVMSDLTKRKATREDLRSVPEDKTGEIIDGELIVTSEPSWKRHLAATLLDDMLAMGCPIFGSSILSGKH
jgi:hypothetical protein